MLLKKSIFCFFLIFILAALASADMWTSSLISGNTTWQKNNGSGDGIYIIDVDNDTLIVADGVTLTIEPGVTVKFHDDIKLVIYGTLNAVGLVNDSIIFISDDGAGSAEAWGGIKLLSTDSTYTNLFAYCRIENGDADDTDPWALDDAKNGGGIYFGENIRRNSEILHSVIQNNHAYEGGGGIFCRGNPTITSCSIKNNSADQYGGGIGVKGPSLLQFSKPQVSNSFIIDNTTNGQGGGGVALLSGAVLEMNNSLVGRNTALNGNGGGVYLYGATTIANIVNSIIGGNTADIDNQISGTANVSYSNIEDGYSGTGNIDEDPEFFDEDNNDFHFAATSPLVDAGDNSNAPATDYDGNSRPFDGDRNSVATADMGPYEYINTAPQITSTPVVEATEDQNYSYQVTTLDTDSAEVLTYSLTEAPEFLSINSATGEISGIPATDATAGDHSVTVQVADLNNATDTQFYTLHVTAVNDAPVVSGIPDQTIEEGQTFTTVNLDNYVTDEENAAADISWEYSGNLQLNVNIENRVATISIPDTNWYGSETITFTGTDPGGLSDSDAALFTVSNINDAPVVTDIPDQTIDEGAAFTQINLDDYVDDIDNVESDLDWTSSGSSELTVTIDANRVATISIPDENWFGSETITFTATDPGGLADSNAAIFTITAVNDAPVVSGIPDQSINEGQTFLTINLDDYVTDVDNSAEDMNWTSGGNTDLTVTIAPNRVATVTIPNENWYGSETITFTATDPGGLSGNDPASFTVVNVNDAPVAANDTSATNEDIAVTIHVLNNDTDIDNDNLIVTKVSAAGNGLISIQNDTVVVYTPAENWHGSDSFTYTVSDGNGGLDSAEVSVTVNPFNDAPVVSGIPDQSVNEGHTFLTINLDDYVTDVDNSAEDMNWTSGGNTDLTVTIAPNRVATVTIPNENWYGSETITFTATDPGGLSGNAPASFTVVNVNDAPVVSVIDNQTISEGGSFTVIDLNEAVTDIDNSDEEISWSVKGNSDLQVSIDINNQATVTAPNPDWFGSETLMFKATDPGGLADSASVDFTVSPVNDNPVVANIPDQTITEGQTFAMFDLDTLVSDVDDPDSTLNWTYEGAVQLTVEISVENLVTIILPDSNWNGSEQITFIATDTSGSLGSDAAVFTVQAANDPPLVSDIPNQTIAEGDSFVVINLNNYVTDVDNEQAEITWTASGSTELEAYYEQANQTMTILIPDTNWFGAETITFTASDPGGLFDQDSAVFSVTAVNDAPIADAIANQTAPEGQSFASISLDDFVADVDDTDSTLSWSASYYLNLSVQIENHILTVSPLSPEWNGTEVILLTVADTSGLTDSVSVSYTVTPVNDSTCFVAALPELTFNEDDSLVYAVSNWYPFAEDKDNADSTLTFVASAGKQVSAQLKESSYMFKSPQDWFGCDTLLLTVSDGEFTDSSYFRVVVKSVNDAPEIVGLPMEISFDNDTTYVLNMKNFSYDVDTADSLLAWSFSVDNDSLLNLYNSNIGLLTLSAEGFSGTVQLICTLTDDSAAHVKDTISVQVISATAIEDLFVNQLPTEYKLDQNFPNPFNPTTTINYQLPVRRLAGSAVSQVRLTVFNVLGQKVATLVNEKQQAGYYSYQWNASAFANGVYFYRIQAGKFTQVRKMILMK